MRLMSIPAGQPRRHEDGQEMATRSQGGQARIHSVSIYSHSATTAVWMPCLAAALMYVSP